MTSEITDLSASEARRLEQAKEIMELQADLSTALTTIAAQKAAVEQHFRDSQGHNHCFRNNPRLWEAFGLTKKPEHLPPEDEFQAGCDRFRAELYSHPERWPDFMGTTKKAPLEFYMGEYLKSRGWKQNDKTPQGWIDPEHDKYPTDYSPKYAVRVQLERDEEEA